MNQKFDYFNGELAVNAKFVGDYDIPYVESDNMIPKKIITFSKCIKSKDFDRWVVFYEDDKIFERLWNNPHKYLPILKKYKGVVGPDFSLYGDYPIAIQIYNVYRSRLITHWLKQNGIKVIPNVRWSTDYSYSFCFDGLKKKDIVFVGSHGCSKKNNDKKLFFNGMLKMIETINPRIICVYGKANNEVFTKLKKQGVQIISFESEYSLTHEVK